MQVQASGRGRQRLRRPLWLALILPIAALAWPGSDDAHGLVGRAYLAVPAWPFAWGGGEMVTFTCLDVWLLSAVNR